jgi:hypothetical protein
VVTVKDLPNELVVAAIEAHLRAHPLATDSAVGVARWWVGMALGDVGVEQVEAALSLLVDRSVLRRLILADGSVLYAQSLPTHQ